MFPTMYKKELKTCANLAYGCIAIMNLISTYYSRTNLSVSKPLSERKWAVMSFSFVSKYIT